MFPFKIKNKDNGIQIKGGPNKGSKHNKKVAKPIKRILSNPKIK